MSPAAPLEPELAESDAWSSMLGDDVATVGPAIVCHAPGVDSIMLNRVQGLGIARPATDQDLEEIGELYGSTVHAISLAPTARPAELEGMLRARGYAPGYAWVKFVRPVTDLAPVETSLRVELIGPDLAEEFARVITKAYGIPPGIGPDLAGLPGRPGWSCYLAFDGDTAAAAGALHVGPAGGWLGAAGTLPEFRKRGGQGAIMIARIRRAAEMGAQLVVTETGENLPDRPSNSYRNILRHGFKVAYVRPNFVSGAGD